MLKTITCICCPKGCLVTLDTDKPEETAKGFGCPQGKEYAIGELTHPMRTISSTVEIKGGVICCVGNEGNGLSQAVIEECAVQTVIPMQGRAESFNASAAAAILAWELIR